MGRFRLWNHNKSKDYLFIDKIVNQQMHAGGTDIFVHKYLGPKGLPDDEISELNIQDVLFLENRDRKYADDIIILEGVYNVNDLDFNLSAFGLMLSGDTLFITFHLNEMVDRLGRKLVSGDVLELRHKRDDLLLDPDAPAVNAFYVIRDGSRSAEGYGPSWYPHLWRIKAEPIVDSQEYADIFNKVVDDCNTLKDTLSNVDKLIDLNDLVIADADKEVPHRNFDSSHYWIKRDGDQPTMTALNWIFNGDGKAPNSDEAIPCGAVFPQNPINGQFFLRDDYNPPRLFERQENRWVAIEEKRLRDYVPAHRVLEEFINETDTLKLNSGEVKDVRQAVTKIVPREGPPINILDDECDNE